MAQEIPSIVQTTARRHHLFDVGDRVVVGVSGGPDSLCLLHVLRHGLPRLALELHVAHLHHGIRGHEADRDAAYVHQIATEWRLPYATTQVDVPSLADQPGASLEEAARQARYAFLVSVARRVGATVIAVGHNGDDQAETVLMHWLRGAGLAGLRGMQHSTPLDTLRFPILPAEDRPQATGLRLVRPLLDVSREQILAYCAAHGLRPRFDRSNLDTTHYRNRLRHELLPILKTYNPQIKDVLRRSAAVMGDDYDTLRAVAGDAWQQCVRFQSSAAVKLDLAAWRDLPLSLQRSLLRDAVWHLRTSLRDVGFEQIERAAWLAREGETGSQATLPGGLLLTLGYDHLLVADGSLQPSSEDVPLLYADTLPVGVPGTTILPSRCWSVTVDVWPRASLPMDWEVNTNPWHAYLDADVVGKRPRLRSRQPGDRFQPLGMRGHSSEVATFMTNVKLEQRLRDNWPLLIGAQGIAWVVGHREDERHRVSEATGRIMRVRFHRR